jgi:hypothetical protein
MWLYERKSIHNNFWENFIIHDKPNRRLLNYYRTLHIDYEWKMTFFDENIEDPFIINDSSEAPLLEEENEK